MKKEIYQCGFCNNSITSHVTALIIIANWDKDQQLQQEQQLFCHMECLKKPLGGPYIMIDSVH